MRRPAEALTHEECVELLARERIGRLAAVAPGGGPLIRPLNYLYDGPSHSIVFRSMSGVKLYSLLHSRKAVFEIDGLESDRSSAWSVIVHGVCEEVTRPLEVARLNELGLESWAGEQARRWFRLRAGAIHGRRFRREA